MTDAERGYLAGLLDGEGYIGVVPRSDGYVSAAVGLCMTCRAPLDWAAAVTGRGKVYKRSARGTRKPVFEWKPSAVEHCAAILRDVVPLLRVKQGQARAFLVLAALRAAKAKPFGPNCHRQAEHMVAKIVRCLKECQV